MIFRASLFFVLVLAAECRAQSITGPTAPGPLTTNQQYLAQGTCAANVYQVQVIWYFKGNRSVLFRHEMWVR